MIIIERKIYQEIAKETIDTKVEYLKARKEEIQFNYDTQMAEIEAELSCLEKVCEDVKKSGEEIIK